MQLGLPAAIAVARTPIEVLGSAQRNAKLALALDRAH